MALLGPVADYTDKDFDAIRARLFAMIPTVFPDWTDQDVADFGNLLVELFSHVMDVVTFYQDNQAAEAFIGRATQRKNLIALAKLLDYQPRGQTASQVDLTLTLTRTVTPGGAVTVPAGDFARTEQVVDPVRFQTLGAVVWNAGEVGARTSTAENSEQRQELFSSNGTPDLEFRLSGSPFLEGSLVVAAGNGGYTEVDNFLESTSTDRHFVVVVDQNDRATVRFGDGTNGAIPTGTVSCSYKIGGGAGGRVNGGAIVRLEKSYTDEFGNPVTIACTNAARSSEALDRQTIEEIRTLAPLKFRAPSRTVAREDFEIHALLVPGVARALMLTSDQDPGIAENSGLLYVIPDGGGAPTTGLKAAVLEMVTVTYPSTLTFQVTVVDGVFLVVDVQATVFLRQGAVPATVRAAINAGLAQAFALKNSDGTANDGVDFGYNLRDANGDATGSIAWSDLFDIVRDTAGVRKIEPTGFLLNGAAADVPIAVRQFPQLGTVTLINGDTAAAL